MEIEYDVPGEMFGAEFTVLLYELRTDMAAYLASLPGEDMPRDLADLDSPSISRTRATNCAGSANRFSNKRSKRRMKPHTAKREPISLRLAGEEGIDRLMREHQC